MIFTVYAASAEEVKKRLDRIAAKAARYSVPFSYTVSEERSETVSVYEVDHVTSTQRKVEQHTVAAVGMDVLFGDKDGKRYAVIAEYRCRGPSRSGGRWHGSPGVYDVYFRVNFSTREAGNAAYLRVKQLFRSFRVPYSGCCECHGAVTFEQIKAALSAC